MADKKKIELYTLPYFRACAIGGILSCGLTHLAVTPLDHVKCNVQANPKLFPSTGAGFSQLFKGELAAHGYGSGASALVKGWGPTLAGYGVQGACKFGFYEIFKWKGGDLVGWVDKEGGVPKHQDLVYLCASASAEVIADVMYCPFEALKVRLQTQPAFAKGLVDGLPKFIKSEGFGSLYSGLVPLWARQVPYTVIKFMAFERIAQIYYGLYKPKAACNQWEQMGVVFAAGYTAGIVCGVVSHPADTMVSKINKVQMEGSMMQKVKHIYGDIGFRGLWAGLPVRVAMIGTLTGLQWFIYGAYKSSVGLPSPGASAKK